MAALEDLLTLSPESFRERLIAGLTDEDYALFPGFLRDSVTAEVRREMDHFRGAGRFRPAGIGKGAETRREQETRGDGIHWLEPEDLTPVQTKLAAIFSSVRESLNENLFLGLWDWEGHYAIYPPGAFYRKHVDRFANDSRRTVSIVFFFNPEWTEAAGGALRLETAEGPLDIPPIAGTAVFFRSERVPHEVRATTRDRYSFAGWLRTRV
jgi:SM-20-related protein